MVKVSKADLFEAAWDLAALCNDAGSADDHASTAAKLHEFINARRRSNGLRPLPALTVDPDSASE